MYELKMDLKARAAEIRQTKSEVKEEQRKNEPTFQAILVEMR